MNDVWITCFQAATETLNFTTAAQNVHISQPSFSRNIAMLEEELGFQLFWRSKQNGIRLTPAGAALYKGLFEIEEQYLELLEKARQISRGEEGKLVIGILNGTMMDSQTFYHIKKFQKKFPQVEVQLKSCTLGSMERNLLNGSCDLCFLMANILKEKDLLLWEKIYKVKSYFVVPKSAGFEQGAEYEMSDLKDQTFLLSADFSEINENVINHCRSFGFEPKIKMAPDSETKMLWAELGEGAAGITRDQYICNSEHVSIIKVKSVTDMDFSICWSKENYNPAIALFYSMVDEIKAR